MFQFANTPIWCPATRKPSRQRRVAIQLFRVLPSSNYMRARRKLVSSSGPGEKGTCPLSHKNRLSPRKAAIRVPGGSLRFLIANPRLKFAVSHRRINHLRISNREQMAIFCSGGRFRIPPLTAESSSNVEPPASNLEFLIGTLDISESESTRRKQATKPNANRHKSDV
jgi:hypothetical protein